MKPQKSTFARSCPRAAVRVLTVTAAVLIGLVCTARQTQAQATCSRRVNFEGLAEGTIVSHVNATPGTQRVLVKGSNPRLGADRNAAIIYDSSCDGGCTGGDADLGTPNQGFGGPGVGTGGAPGGTAPNDKPLGNLLIVAQNLRDANGDNRVDDPNDANDTNVTLSLDFAEIGPISPKSLGFVDVDTDEQRPVVDLRNAAGTLLTSVTVPRTGANGVKYATFPAVTGVAKMLVRLFGSAAIDELTFDQNCDDGSFCNGTETCSESGCAPGTNPCPGRGCDEAADQCLGCDENADCGDGLFCNGEEICSGGICGPGSDPCPGRGCNENSDTCFGCASNAECDDQVGCTNDVCGADHVCTNAPDDTSCPTTTCSTGVCAAGGAGCTSVPTNEGGVCDDGDPCTAVDLCVAGVCVGSGGTCGDGVVQGVCGEDCEPPGSVTCTDTCTLRPVCLGPIPPAGVDCSAPDAPATLCDPCQLVCFPGAQPAVRRAAKRIAFVSDMDYVGENTDENPEIHLFDLEFFRTKLAQGAEPIDALLDSVAQVTKTELDGNGDPALNERPTLSGSGRYVAFTSTGDAVGDGLSNDGNREIFEIEMRLNGPKQPRSQALSLRRRLRVTDTSGVENLGPTLRALRGNLLVFDSPANLVPNRCVDGSADGDKCTSDAQCAGGTCGNVDGNRELFLWNRRQQRKGGFALRQITTATEGDSSAGVSARFETRTAAFVSDANLVGENPDRLSQIFRIIKTPAKLLQITQVTSSPGTVAESWDPSHAGKPFVAFVSNGDIVGENAGRTGQVFLWREREGTKFLQLTRGPDAGCRHGSPAIDATGRFVAFESSCDVLPTPNPGTSIFVYQKERDAFLDLTIRAPDGRNAGTPIVTRFGKRIVFELLDDAGVGEAVCVFDMENEHLEQVVPR